MGVYRTYLHPGSFVILEGDLLNTLPSCHRIVEVHDQERIVVQAFIPFSDANIREFRISEPHAKYIPEVCRSPSTLTIHPKLIVDIAFVFKSAALLDGTFRNVQGMTNAFILRFISFRFLFINTMCWSARHWYFIGSAVPMPMRVCA
jgi:hypothetical protein